jgi:glycine/D-amino acid oxidase-like deaminating enzyme/nitrite reductase/ring-hydroxylating ferredoxin subunit
MKRSDGKRMPQFPEPYWRDSVTLPRFQTLTEDLDTEVVIVGGGISGITTAYRLTQAGRQVVLVDAGRLFNGTTGHTTAKITAQHDLIYDELIQHLGEEKAKQYYQANRNALQFIRDQVKNQGIDCDLREEDAVLYATTKASAQKIRKEHQAYLRLGIDGSLSDSIPFDIPVEIALTMHKQAQFHPLKYLLELVRAITDSGGRIFEKTTALDIIDQERPQVLLRGGQKVTADHVVICSHFPFWDKKGFYFARMVADRSYILGVKAKKPYPGGMYLSVDHPVRSLRSAQYGDEELVLVAGENHKTGQGIPTIKHYEALEAFAEQTLGIESIPYRWSAQDLVTLDKVPYIGPITNDRPHILVATGYRKWGMSHSTVAGLLLSDSILGKQNPYQELYSPSRFHSDPSIKHLITQNADVAAHLIAGKVGISFKQVEELAPDEAAVVMVNGKRSGAYRDKEGVVHVVDTTCRHMGCEVEWNAGDRTWDCPCHGSRYSVTGDVIEGPATQPLQRVTIQEKEPVKRL